MTTQTNVGTRVLSAAEVAEILEAARVKFYDAGTGFTSGVFVTKFATHSGRVDELAASHEALRAERDEAAYQATSAQGERDTYCDRVRELRAELAQRDELLAAATCFRVGNYLVQNTTAFGWLVVGAGGVGGASWIATDKPLTREEAIDVARELAGDVASEATERTT